MLKVRHKKCLYLGKVFLVCYMKKEGDLKKIATPKIREELMDARKGGMEQ